MAVVHYELVGADTDRPFSPHCWKTRMALAHKGLDTDPRRVTFMQVPTVEDGASRTVPVIRDGERVVADSFAIAEYLEATYPDRPTLFGGEAGRALSRFVEAWMAKTVHPQIVRFIVTDIHDALDDGSKGYFRESREKMLGRSLEAVVEGRDERLAAFHGSLAPMAVTLERQPWLGGEGPLFADYILFGAFQWARVASPFDVVPQDGAIADWFSRCLDLHGGEARSVPAAA